MRHTVLVLVFATAACATTHDGVRTSSYHAPKITVAAVNPAICDAITRLAHAEGWSLVTVQPEAGLVEALSAPEITMGVSMRERWRFTMADYDVNVTRMLEVQFEHDGAWQSETTVAAGYGYERERQVLASLGAQFSLAIPVY